MYSLQDDIVFFIMNKCSWDWWGDGMRLPPHRIAALKAAAEAEAELAARRARPGSYHSFAPPRGAHELSLYESLLGAVATHMYVGQGAAGSGLDDEAGSALDDELSSDEEDEEEEDEEEDEEDEEGEEDEEDEEDEEGAKAEPASLAAAAAALTSGVELD